MHKELVNPRKPPFLQASGALPGRVSTDFSTASADGPVLAFENMARGRIFLVEDEPDIAEVLQYNLEKEGFAVTRFDRGDLALEGLRRQIPDLLLLDLMLPGLDGLELTRVLKREPKLAVVPIIMLTARGEELDRIVGLELGADDYITKPFSPREVVLRAKAVLRRRSQEGASGEILSAGKLRLDVEGHRLDIGGQEVELTATEFRLLRLLIERAGRVQTRSQLLSDVWGYAEDVDSRTVDTHIRRLRKKLRAEAERIETVIGVGYRLRT
jgi:two-component system, OmpR family, phosphate regulon response regulator PhoB